MPAYLTHRAAGERVYEKLTKAALPDKMAFFLGCQGPDILFFSNPLRPMKGSLMLGVEMHSEKTRELLTHSMEFIKSYDGDDKDELISYAAGFLTHYSLDKNAHPFVYGKSGSNTNIHHATEHMWDSFISKEQWGIEPQQFDIYSEVMYSSLGVGICDWYSAAAKNIYDKVLSSDVIRLAQLRLAKVKKMIADISLPGRLLIGLLSGIIGFDVSTMLYPKRRDESLFTSDEYHSMQNMVQSGVEESCSLIELMLDYVNEGKNTLPDWLGDKNFAGELAQA